MYTGTMQIPINQTGTGMFQQTGSMSPQFGQAGGFGQTGSFGMVPQANWQTGMQPSISWQGGPYSTSFMPSPSMAQPRIDLYETNTDLVVACELPNINPSNLSLMVTDDSLSISASAMHPGTTGLTSLYRTVPLPTSIRSEYSSASYRNGILEVRMPKSDFSARRHINISS